VNFPQSVGARVVHPGLEAFADFTREKGFARDMRLIEGTEFLGLDGVSGDDDAKLIDYMHEFISERMQSSGLHPDTWEPAIIRDPKDTRARIAAVAGDKYTYRELDEFTDLIHGWCDGHRAVSACVARRAAVGANVLRTNWGPYRGDIYHALTCAGDLFDLCARPEADKVGQARREGAR